MSTPSVPPTGTPSSRNSRCTPSETPAEAFSRTFTLLTLLPCAHHHEHLDSPTAQNIVYDIVRPATIALPQSTIEISPAVRAPTGGRVAAFHSPT